MADSPAETNTWTIQPEPTHLGGGEREGHQSKSPVSGTGERQSGIPGSSGALEAMDGERGGPPDEAEPEGASIMAASPFADPWLSFDILAVRVRMTSRAFKTKHRCD